MNKGFISFILVLTLLLTPLSTVFSVNAISSEDTVILKIAGSENYDYAYEVLLYLNNVRKANGLSELSMDSVLLEGAMQRAVESYLLYSHTRPNGKPFYTVCEYRNHIGESLAYGDYTPQELIDSWMSEGNNIDNILDPQANSVGVGCFIDENECMSWSLIYDSGSPRKVSKSGIIPVIRSLEITKSKVNLDADIYAISKPDTYEMSVYLYHSDAVYGEFAKVAPSSFDFFSSDTAAATVDESGIITGKTKGAVTISAKIKSDNNIDVIKTFIMGDNFFSIPDDAVGFRGNYYKYFDNSISWSQAKLQCESIGGHLVTINSETEQKFLIDLIKSTSKKNMWIGAYPDNGDYKWITGEPFAYSNWAPGEPNNVFNMQNAAMMYTQNASYAAGTWNDENENGRNWTGYYLSDFGYVCEWEGAKTSQLLFGADRFTFGQDITGYVGDVIDSLVVYTSSNENIASLDITSSNTDVVEIGTIEIGVGDYITTSENEHIATIPLKLKAEGMSAITITSPEGVSESVIVTVSKKPEAKKSIAIFTTEKSLSVNTGDSMWLAFGLMDESSGLIDDDWKKMAVVVSDPSILSLSEYEKTEYGYALNIIGKKEGSTNVTISDTATGISTSIVISVYDKYIKSYSYSMHEVNEFYPNNKLEYNIKTNIYNLNGLYVNNYCCTPIYNSTGTPVGNVGETPKEFQVTFDVYNSRYYNGAVDIYDADGVWIGSEYIDRYSDITSIRDTGEQLFFLISDVITGEIFTYEQASFSKKTSINIKVPNGGYFTISNNMSESPGTFFVNAFEILYDTTSDLIDFATSKSTDKTAFDKFYKEATKSFAQNVIDARNESLSGEAKKMAMEVALNSLKSEIEKIQKKFIKSEAKDFVINGTEMYSDISTLAENVLNSYSVNWKHLYQSATGVGESMFIKFSGPAGVALKSMFAITKASNKLLMAAQMSRSLNNTYATFYSSIDEGYINPHGIVVNTNGNVDSEAVLQVFKVSDNDTLDVVLNSDNPLEKYELYNICFVKDDELVQPNGKVKVYVPIPDGMNGNTCKIYRQETDGSWTILDAHIEDNYLVFETDHFSLYSVIGNMDNLSIYSMPNKVVYSDGDTLETDGLVLDLNGKKITEGFICNPTVISGSGNLQITVKYGNLSTDFNVVVKQPGNYSIRGQIESFGESSSAITLNLLENGILIDKTTSTDGTYKFDSVSSGTYTVEVSKLNHVTRTYDVIVVDEDVVQNLKIHLLGDVTGDGKVNTIDVNRVYAHVRETNPLAGYELKCANVAGTGDTVNTIDVNRIYAHVKETNLLW